MRRFVAITLILGILSLFMIACGGDVGPTEPVNEFVADDADKAPDWPIIFDPPEGFDQFLFAVSDRFETIVWVDSLITVNLVGDEVMVQPEGYEPIHIAFRADPMVVIPASDPPLTWTFTLSLPEAPASGIFYAPGDCMFYRTRNLPPAYYGEVDLRLPIMDFYNLDSYDGTFTSYYMDTNEFGYPDAYDVRHVVAESWPPRGNRPTVYVEVVSLAEKDGPSSATDRVLDPLVLGDEE